MCKVSMRMTKVLVLLAAVFLALSVFPAENALGTDSGMQKAFEFVKEWIIPDIRGSAIWALLGKMATAMVFLGLIFFSYFIASGKKDSAIRIIAPNNTNKNVSGFIPSIWSNFSGLLTMITPFRFG